MDQFRLLQGGVRIPLFVVVAEVARVVGLGGSAELAGDECVGAMGDGEGGLEVAGVEEFHVEEVVRREAGVGGVVEARGHVPECVGLFCVGLEDNEQGGQLVAAALCFWFVEFPVCAWHCDGRATGERKEEQLVDVL